MNRVNIDIFDTTLRDGAQSLPAENQFPNSAKPEIADEIARLGVSVIEAGFPATPGDWEETAEVASTVGQTKYQTGEHWGTPSIAGLSRVHPDDITKTWTAVSPAIYPRIHTFVSTDSEHMAAKFPDKTPSQVLEMGRSAIQLARDYMRGNPNSSLEFSAEAATTTETAYLEKIVRMAVGEGVDVINVPDTVGQRDPYWMRSFYARVIQWALSENPDVTVSAHNHNDLGMATVNTLALVYAAADYADVHQQDVNIQLETTVTRLGERAGNADVFSVVGGLEKFSPGMPARIEWVFNPNQSVSVAGVVMDFAGLEVHRQTPMVGRDTNVHRSGIHSDGVIKGGYKIYTPHDPTYWGHQTDAVHEGGKYQGRRGRQAASA